MAALTLAGLGILAALGWAFAVLAVAGSLYAVITVVLVLRFFDPQTESGADESAVDARFAKASFLKPLHGAEAGLHQNLGAHFVQDARIPYEIVSGAQRADDPALDVARTVMAEHPNLQAVISVGDRPEILNRKIANLIQMFPRATGDVVVMTDSDIRPPADHLRRVLAALQAPGVGVVTCPYYGVGATGFWSRVAALGLRYQFLPNVITGVSLGMASPCMGSTIALRRSTLEDIGGLDAVANTLADDYAIGARVRGLGLKSVVAPVLVAHSCSESTLADVFSHELRWARTIKGVDFAGHAGSLVTHPVPLALTAVILTGFSPVALALLTLAIVARFLLSFAIDRSTPQSDRLLWLLPLRDMLSFAVFAASFVGQTVEWRGEKLHVTPKGDLSPV